MRAENIVALFYTLLLGFTADSDRSIQASLERYVQIGDCDKLTYLSFHGWFSPAFVAVLREISMTPSGDLDIRRNDMRGHFESVRDILIVNATFISLY